MLCVDVKALYHPHMTFGTLIRQARFDKRMTQEQLAITTNLSRQTIMSIETGKDTRLSIALRIARVLDISLDSLK